RATYGVNFLEFSELLVQVLVVYFKDGDVFMRGITTGLIYEVTALALLALYNKLMAVLTTNVTVVGSHYVHFQAKFLKDRFVGAPHLLVRFFKLLFGTKTVS